MGRWPTRSPRTHSTRARLAFPVGVAPARSRLVAPRLWTNNGAFHAGRYVTRSAFRPTAPRRAARRRPARIARAPTSRLCPRDGSRSARAGAACDGRAVEPCRIRLEPLDLARSYVGRVRRETVTYCGSTFLLAVFGSTSTTILGSEREATETFSRRPLCATTKAKRHSPAPGPAAPGVSSASNSIILSPIKPFRRGSPPSSVVSVPPCTSCTR